MKTVKVSALILTIALVICICTPAASAAGKEVIEGQITLRFVEGDSHFVGDGETGGGNTILPANSDGTGNTGSGGSGGGSGSNIRRDADSSGGTSVAAATVAIGDRVVPLSDTVSVPDPDIPLSDADFFGNLPKTGGDTLIPILLVMLGVTLMIYANGRIDVRG